MLEGIFDYRVLDGREGGGSSLDAISRLRYQVYVNECGFERAEDHPDGLERDEYDRHAIHFYACPRQSDDVIGAARVILDAERPLPIERYFAVDREALGIGGARVAEISRLAISKEFRCRAIDRAVFRMAQPWSQLPLFPDPGGEFRRRCEQELVRGLYVTLYRESLAQGLTHWFAVMARGLQVILKRWGIGFEQIGPARDYHGIRAPYLACIAEIERALEDRAPTLHAELQGELVAYA